MFFRIDWGSMYLFFVTGVAGLNVLGDSTLEDLRTTRGGPAVRGKRVLGGPHKTQATNG